MSWAPDVLPVIVARWGQGAKLKTPMDLQRTVTLPTWHEGQDRQWHTYAVQWGVYHLGSESTSGHYHSFWFHPGRETLHVGDDATRPKQVQASDRKQVLERCYILFLVKQQ